MGHIRETEILARIIEAGVLNKKVIGKSDSQLGDFLLNFLNIDPFINKIQIITVDGNSLAASNLSLTSINYKYHSKKIPEGAKYLLQIGERVGAITKLTNEFKGSDFENLLIESQDEETDPRDESSYRQNEQWPRAYWEFKANTIEKQGALTISVPLWNLEKQFEGVISIDLELNQLSNFVNYQHIGNTGEVFILNEEGNFIFPLIDKVSPFYQSLLGQAYVYAQKMSDQDFIIANHNQEFLFSIFDFHLSPETRWFIVTMVPFEDFFHEMIKKQQEAFYIALGFFLILALLTIFSSRHISVPIVKLAQQVEKIRNFNFSEEPPLNSLITEIDQLDTSISSMRTAIKAFGLYVPKEIVNTLIQKQGSKIGIGGSKARLTIFFSDIANFTAAAESLDMEQLFTWLTEYFDALSKIILELDGTIDKFIGDSVMAFWGAPKLVEDRQEKACLAALRCQKICQNSQKENRPFPWKTRIGIHSGEVIVGNIGTPERINYTAIGDVVNACSRIEGINKEYGTSILISETVHEAIGSQFLSRPIDFSVVKGKKNKILLYELVAAYHVEKDLAPTPEQILLCEKFKEGYFLVMEGQKKEAKEIFLRLQEQFPDDKPTQVYLERL